MSIKRNILLMYVTAGLMWGRFYLPVLALFYIASRVPIEQFAIIMSVFALVTLIFEVPSGVITDLIGKKKALLICRFLYLIEIALVAFFNGFWIFLIAKIISGIAVSLSSGTTSALTYDTLKKMKREKEYKRIEGIKATIEAISMAVIFVIGAFLFTINYKLPAYVSLPVLVVGFILTFFFEEPYKSKKKVSFKNALNHLKESLSFFKKSKYLKFLAFFSLAIASVISIILSLSSAYYQAIAIPVALMGVLGVIVSIITAISAKKAHFIENKLKERKSFFLMWALLLISVFFMAIMFKYIGFIFLMFIPFVDGFFGVVIDSYANDYIGTSHRTTLLSVKNMFNNIGIFILFPIVGYLTKAFSLQFALLSMGAFFLLYSVFLYILYKKLGLKIK